MALPSQLSFHVEHHEVLESTQDLVRARLKAGEKVAGLVVRAQEQRQGRGRRGSSWLSSPGGSYQSIAIGRPAPPKQLRTVPLAIASGLAETFTAAGLQLMIKWPNDLYYLGAKLGGILAEHYRRHLIIGIGLNVANQVPPGAATLRGWRLEVVNDMVLDGVRLGLELLEQPSRLKQSYASFDLLWGHRLLLEIAGEREVGLGAGITEEGCLRLERAGVVRVFCAGRVMGFVESRAG